jgi:hypothetical protein
VANEIDSSRRRFLGAAAMIAASFHSNGVRADRLAASVGPPRGSIRRVWP